jgi:hypothetical protein
VAGDSAGGRSEREHEPRRGEPRPPPRGGRERHERHAIPSAAAEQSLATAESFRTKRLDCA